MFGSVHTFVDDLGSPFCLVDNEGVNCFSGAVVARHDPLSLVDNFGCKACAFVSRDSFFLKAPIVEHYFVQWRRIIVIVEVIVIWRWDWIWVRLFLPSLNQWKFI